MPSKNPYPKRQIITSCSECRRVITVRDVAVWQRRGATGIVHADCAVDPDATPVRAEVVTYRCGEQW